MELSHFLAALSGAGAVKSIQVQHLDVFFKVLWTFGWDLGVPKWLWKSMEPPKSWSHEVTCNWTIFFAISNSGDIIYFKGTPGNFGRKYWIILILKRGNSILRGVDFLYTWINYTSGLGLLFMCYPLYDDPKQQAWIFGMHWRHQQEQQMNQAHIDVD